MNRIILCTILLFQIFFTNAQENISTNQNPFYAEFLTGPYLILDGTIYESVLLRGTSIGYEYSSGIAIGIEYLVGNQEDLQGQLGTTHSAFGTIKYFFTKRDDPRRFRPYVFGGSGFFEFKDFSADVLGIAFYLGVGTELKISKNIHSFLEPRYVNLGLMDANGTHQFGMIWGVRARF